MSEPASVSSGIADRYATAVFEISRDGGQIDQLENDVTALDEVLTSSSDFRELINSPVYSRDAQSAGIGAVAAKMGLSATVANTLKLMASKRRLFVLPAMIASLRRLIADAKGEVTAEVKSARALSDAQQSQLAETLKARMGQDVKMTVTVDEALIGGLIVKVGSKMIDTSIRSKLDALQNTMKEVG